MGKIVEHNTSGDATDSQQVGMGQDSPIIYENPRDENEPRRVLIHAGWKLILLEDTKKRITYGAILPIEPPKCPTCNAVSTSRHDQRTITTSFSHLPEERRQ
jgi:hypothetical protein